MATDTELKAIEARFNARIDARTKALLDMIHAQEAIVKSLVRRLCWCENQLGIFGDPSVLQGLDELDADKELESEDMNGLLLELAELEGDVPKIVGNLPVEDGEGDSE
jgi:hypothetical protein